MCGACLSVWNMTRQTALLVSMPADQLFVCLLTLAVMALFIWEKLPMEIVSLGALLLLLVVPFNGHPILIPPGKTEQTQVLGSIFGNNAVLVVAFMFIVGAAVERTGLVDDLGHWFERIAGRSQKRIFFALGILTICSSAFLNNTTVVVVFIPMLIGLCKRIQMPPSRFLIPLSYFAICGGLITIIGTSTNLVVNGILQQKGLAPFAMFDIAPLGIVFSVATLIFLICFGRKLLPDRPSLAALINVDDSREFLTAAIVSADSPLVDKTLLETPLAKMRDSQVMEIRRNGNRVDAPIKEVRFQAGDRIIFKSHLSGVVDINALKGIEMAAKSEMGLSYVQTEQAVLVEGMLGRLSRMVGHTLNDANLRQQYGVIILAVHRQGVNLRSNFENEKLEVGDTILLEGSKERVRQLFEERDLINLTQPKEESYRRSKSWIALVALLMVIILGSFDFIAFEWVAMAAALLVTGTGCLKSDEAYRSIDWGIITMILGTLGLGMAMDITGAAHTIIEWMMTIIGTWDKRLIVSAVLLFAIIMTEVLSNTAVAALVTPLAISLAHDLGCNWQPFVVAVMAGASIGFAIPAGYQTHMLVFGPGGYRFNDFCRAGIPLDIIMWILGSICIPLFWPL